MYVGTTQTADLLGVSPARVRCLLNQGRIKAAYKIGKIWVIPLFNGMPIITKGSRGPKAKWFKRLPAVTRIHVNRQAISQNNKREIPKPVISVKKSGNNTSAHRVKINGPCEIIYSHKKAISGGAKVWIETYFPVEIISDPFEVQGSAVAYSPLEEVLQQVSSCLFGRYLRKI
ncbi:MAG: helix-turn-helix domain-containing protein [Nostocaceae cyanobacterium]|nr:helix-turn-helix domain-containing protein [Nostocaceae cyanobacterium]